MRVRVCSCPLATPLARVAAAMAAAAGGGVHLTPELALQRVFGHSVLRAEQRRAVGAALAGKDSLVVMATGAGKSVWRALPLLISRSGGRRAAGRGALRALLPAAAAALDVPLLALSRRARADNRPRAPLPSGAQLPTPRDRV